MAYHFSNRNVDERFTWPELRETNNLFMSMNPKAGNLVAADTSRPAAERAAELQPVIEGLMSAAAGAGADDGGNKKTLVAPAIADAVSPHDVEFEVAYPSNYVEGKRLPAIFEISGGGLWYLSDKSYSMTALADDLGAIVVMPFYRTILDEGGQYPGTVDDLHAVYQYVLDHAKEMGINKNRIVLRGLSSGGHLALALCHRLKRYGIFPRGCAVLEPVMDERLIYPTSAIESTGWDAECVYRTANAWLDYMPSVKVPAEAFPNHATAEECIGLPPTIIYEAQDDPCSDPCLEYYSKLSSAGVFATLRIYGGLNHMTFAAESEYTSRMTADFKLDILSLFENDLTRKFTLEEE